jgi:hypothetical protein
MGESKRVEIGVQFTMQDVQSTADKEKNFELIRIMKNCNVFKLLRIISYRLIIWKGEMIVLPIIITLFRRIIIRQHIAYLFKI